MGKISQKELIRITAEALSKAAGGDYSSRVTSRGKHDELDSLAQAVNSLLDTLNERTTKNISTGEEEGDIKQATEALQHSENRLRTIFETSQTGIILVDPEGIITFANSRMAEMFGCPHDELVGTSYSDHLHPDEKSPGNTLMNRLITGEVQSVSTERHYVRRDGSDFWGHLTGRRMLDQDGNFISLVGTIADISEKKRLEMVLQESEARYRILAENANDIIFTMDTNLRFTYISPSVTRIRGYTVEEAMAQSPVDALTPASLELAIKVFKEEQRIEEGETKDLSRTRTLEMEERCKDGSTIWTETTFSLLRDRENRAIGFMGITRDITGRKRAEDALRQSEERYRSIFENTGNATVIFSEDGTIQLANSFFERLSGYTRQEIEGSMNWKDFVNGEDLVRMERYHRQGLDDPQSAPSRYEFSFIDRSGSEKHILLTVALIKGTREWISSLMDITDRKKAEEEVLQSRIQLQAILDASLDAITVTDEKGMFLASNKALQDRWGRSRDEIIGHSAGEVLTPEIFDSRLERVRRCISSGLSDHFVDRQGGLLFENTIAPIVEADGSIRTVAMFSRDDTERKRVEDELISLTQRLNDIIDLMPDATFVIDQDKKIIAWNRAIEEMTGVGKDHMLGKGDYEYALPFFDERKPILIDILDMPEAQIETFYKYVNRHSGKIFAESYITRLNNGRGAHLWAVAAPLYDKDGNRFGSIEVIKDMTDLMLKEEARLKTETRYREILEEIDDGYYEVDLMGSFTFFNNTMCRILRYTPDEMIGLNNRTYMDGENAQKVFATFNQVFMTGKPDKAFEWGLIRKDGTRCIVETSVSLMHDDREIATGFRGIARDVTGQKNLQQQLIQAQKMESIGRLTGGIAHDFNNMLTPIMGYAELLLNQLPPDDPRRINVENIIHSAERSRDLVRQLLAFARKQTLEMKPLDINSVITSFEKILRRTLHENLAIETRLQPAIGSILADVGQIEQIIMNLAVNAQDAMPGGGTLFIETGQAYLDETYVAMHKGSTAGDYIMLALSDTGVGMDNAVLSQVFEPFFTTKAPGKGTGLGLSTAYGIVKQHNGYIMVYSEPGRGTIFRIYFPRHGASAQMVVELQEYREGMTGTETIMVIEDEQLVRDLIVSMLKSAGHTVLEAPDGKTALDLAASFPGDIHLVITDMILPDTNGTALFEDLSAMRHGMKVLCMSGYTPDVISHNKLLNSEAPFIQKPFSLQGFAQKVREILDGM